MPRTSADIDDEPSTTEAISSSLSVVSSPFEPTGSWQLFDGMTELSDGSWLTEAEVEDTLISNTRQMVNEEM